MRLLAAVRMLLADETLANLSDAARLSALVLAAKSSHHSCHTAIRTRELGRWIGMSESTVAHDVLPRFRASGAVKYRATTSQSGQTTGLECVVMPLWRARRSGETSNPLVLSKRELVTLLRLMEALFAPGWGPTATPAGLLAGVQGKGAATDRLALLLLVLQAGSDGRVRMVGGTVPKGRGRAAATMARLLGCSIAGGGKVLARLRTYGVVDTIRADTDSGLFGKSRLVVPGVATAHAMSLFAMPTAGLSKPGDRKSGAPVLEEETDDEPVINSGTHSMHAKPSEREAASGTQRPAATFGDLGKAQMSETPGTPGEKEGVCTATPDITERPGAAPLHTHHPSHADLSGDDADSARFSGEAAGLSGSQPVRARREEPTQQKTSMAAAGRTGEPAGSPLRGERRNLSSPDTAHDNRHQAACQALAAWSAKSGGAAKMWVSLPKGLEAVLAPVESIWGHLNRTGARHRVTAAVHAELEQLRGTFGPDAAEKILTNRLRRRMAAQGQVPVNDPVGWLIGRALPRRSACYDIKCDDGQRMDTDTECTACQVLYADRCMLRRQVAARFSAELAAVPAQQRKEVLESRLREQLAQESLSRALRHGRSAAERSAREAAAAESRAQTEAAEAALQEKPCAACGQAQAGGLCQNCSNAQATEQMIADAVDATVAAFTEPQDLVEQREVAARTEALIRAEVRHAMARCQAQGGFKETISLIGKLTAESAAENHRRSALAHLAQSAEAEAEAAKAKAAELRRSHLHSSAEDALAAAEEAANEARWRTARHLLDYRIPGARAKRPVPAVVEQPDPYRLAAARVRAAMSRSREEAVA